MQIIVVGAGVSGLSSAIRLLEAGHGVTIWTRDLPRNTTSSIAAAIWYPYKAYPEDRVTAWGQRSFEEFCRLADVPGSGVSLCSGIELLEHPAEDPWWRGCVRHFRYATPAELPPGYTDGYVFEAPVIEMGIYLEYLLARFSDLGGRLIQREVGSLEQALEESRIVVNCSGLGARSLVGDTALYPIRGQIVRIAPPPVQRFLLDDDHSNRRGITYLVPRSADCVLGGTAQDDNWSLEPDPAEAQAMIERCARLVPEVRSSQVIGHLVGLRPGRPTVRLEAEPLGRGRVAVHNYGHGGAGVTLSWGCAEEVVELIQDIHQGGAQGTAAL